MNKEIILKQFDGIDKETGITLVSSAVLMTLFAYQGHPKYYLTNFSEYFNCNNDYCSELYRFIYTFLTFFIIPVLIVKFVYKRPLNEFGIKLGDKKNGFIFVFLCILVFPVLTYISSFDPEFLKEYPLWRESGKSVSNFLLWCLLYLFYYIGWEFFFRGFIQFSLKDKIKPFFIIMMQTIPSTIVHIGKPEGETMSAIIGGIIFGAVALHTGSILYPLLVHWYLGIMNEYFCYLNIL